MDAGAHYLDITGEVEVFESVRERTTELERAGVVGMPGVGFDVVPTDCLAAHVKARLPDATHLTLAFRGVGAQLSHGTATTLVENLPKGSLVREGGRLVRIPPGSRAALRSSAPAAGKRRSDPAQMRNRLEGPKFHGQAYWQARHSS